MLALDTLVSAPLLGAYGRAPARAFSDTIAGQKPGQYLLEVSAYKGGDVRTGAVTQLLGAPLAYGALAASQPAGESNTGLVKLFYADRDWVGDPDDRDRANVYYGGRVRTPIIVSRRAPTSPEQSPRVRREFGEIELDNGDGRLDAVVQSYAVDGRQITVRYGPYMGTFSDFEVIADVVGLGWETDRSNVRIPVRDWTYLLDKPLQTNLYGGTGGADGSDDLTGKPKPLCFGRVRNVPAVLVDATHLIYQVHDGAVMSFDGVFERGAEITLDTSAGSAGDVASYAALVSASVSAGQYATCRVQGLFKLGSSPVGQITADVCGDVDDGNYANGVDTVIQRILFKRAGLARARVNATGFATLATAASGEMGWFVDHQSRPSAAAVIDSIVRGVAGFWGAGRDGRIRAGRFPVPEMVSPVYDLDDVSMLNFSITSQPVPRWRQRVAYRPNWTPGDIDLAASVTAERRQFLTERERAVSAANTAILVRHPEARDPAPLVSPFDNDTDGQTLADQVLALHERDRVEAVATVSRLSYLLDLGEPIRVTWPRHGFGSGRTMIITGIQENGRTGTAELSLWG